MVRTETNYKEIMACIAAEYRPTMIKQLDDRKAPPYVLISLGSNTYLHMKLNTEDHFTKAMMNDCKLRKEMIHNAWQKIEANGGR